jgi:hypothetical protein
MQYLIILSPILFIFIGTGPVFSKRGGHKNLVKFIDGKEHTPSSTCELYKLTQLLFKLRKLYGPKVQSSLRDLKGQAQQLDREQRKINGLKVSAYLQQFIMASLIFVMVFLSSSLVSEGTPTLLPITFLQFFSVIFLWISQKLLHRKFVSPYVSRFTILLTLKCLGGSGLSISKVLSFIDWSVLLASKSSKFKEWDKQLHEVLGEWKKTGSGLELGLVELNEEFKFLKEVQTKSYRDAMEISKFLCLIISGFLSYFLFLFSILRSFLS